MPVPTALALAAIFALVVVIATRGALRGRRKPQLAPRALERSTGSVDAERAGPEPRSEPPRSEPVEAVDAVDAVDAVEPAEPAATEARRSITPPVVAEALASEPETASEPAPEAAPEAAAAPAPPPAPAPSAAPVVVASVAAVAVFAPADRASIEAEDPERKKARKLARLFVSEIKLYNEKLVAEGRAAGDLYARLKDSIDQSLVAFERRVPEAVRAEFDYMHDELVRQLAEGDARKLGTHYGRLLRGS
jgi:hypothetical protein